MTVNGMMLLSKVFLGMMIFFLIAAIVVFFALDVRKAWCMLMGKRLPVQTKKKEVIQQTQNVMIPKSVQTGAEITTVLPTEESIDNYAEGYNPTTVLTEDEGETTVLVQQQVSNAYIVMDITFIHTEVTL